MPNTICLDEKCNVSQLLREEIFTIIIVIFNAVKYFKESNHKGICEK